MSDQWYNIIRGDCIEAMKMMPADSIDAVVCDPPYGIDFMGKSWDKPGEMVGTVLGISGGFQKFPPGVKRPEYKRSDPHIFQLWCEAWATEALRVLKPGGHMLAFGGTRMYHRLASGIEDAGFEIRDCIQWLYGSGFCKSWNFNTRISDSDWCSCENTLPYVHEENSECSMRPMPNADVSTTIYPEEEHGEILFTGMQEQGVSTEGVELSSNVRGGQSGMEGWFVSGAIEGIQDDKNAVSSKSEIERVCIGAHSSDGEDDREEPSAGRGDPSYKSRQVGQSAGESEAVLKPQGALDDRALRSGGRCSRCRKYSKEFIGWGTALKPAVEPIVVARKPLIGTVAANVLEYGTGALNIDACRIGDSGGGTKCNNRDDHGKCLGHDNAGRSTSGETVHGPESSGGRWPANIILDDAAAAMLDKQSGDDDGPSRFFYVVKPNKREKEAGLTSTAKFSPTMGNGIGGKEHDPETATKKKNVHPTVKPIQLMRYLVRMVTPPNGIVLDPFTGSGTTGIAALLEGYSFVGCEMSDEYADIAEQRTAHWTGFGDDDTVEDKDAADPVDDIQQQMF